MKIFLYFIIPFLLWSQDAKIIIESQCWASLSNPIEPLTTRKNFKVTILYPEEPNYKTTSYSLVSDTYELNLTKKPKLDWFYSVDTEDFVSYRDSSKISFRVSPYYLREERFDKLLSSDNLFLQTTSEPKMKKKTTGYSNLLKLPNYEYIEYRDVKKYRISNYKNIWEEAQQSCIKQIKDDSFIENIYRYLLYIGVLISLFILYKLPKILTILFRYLNKYIFTYADKFRKLLFSKMFNSYKAYRHRMKEKRIQRIAEEEAVRTQVKRSVENSNEDELKELQNLINKAVAKGDTETAQALLKLLEKKKKNS